MPMTRIGRQWRRSAPSSPRAAQQRQQHQRRAGDAQGRERERAERRRADAHEQERRAPARQQRESPTSARARVGSFMQRPRARAAPAAVGTLRARAARACGRCRRRSRSSSRRCRRRGGRARSPTTGLRPTAAPTARTAAGRAERARDRGVAAWRRRRDGPQRLPDGALEGGAVQVERQVEVVALRRRSRRAAARRRGASSGSSATLGRGERRADGAAGRRTRRRPGRARCARAAAGRAAWQARLRGAGGGGSIG